MTADREDSDSKSSPKLTHKRVRLSSESILQLDKFSSDENKSVGV
jgi:hypothetical protein